MAEVLSGARQARAQKMMGLAQEQALRSSCWRSHCGAVIADASGRLIGAGANNPPRDCPLAACRKDDLPADFCSDRTCCSHAEQRAVYDALARHPKVLVGATIYFLRLDAAGLPQYAGDPYCTICSKMVLDVGVATFVLWQETGFVAYGTDEYNELSFSYPEDSASGKVPS